MGIDGGDLSCPGSTVVAHLDSNNASALAVKGQLFADLPDDAAGKRI
jgi:hypothetical protein